MSIRDIILGGSGWVAYGEQLYTTPGTYTFTVPSKITSICALCVGGGAGGGKTNGGGGGALAYANNIAVTPGQQIQVVVGAGGAGHYVGYTVVSYDYMVSNSSYVSYGTVSGNINNYPTSPYNVGDIVNFQAGGGLGQTTVTMTRTVFYPLEMGNYDNRTYTHTYSLIKTYTSPYDVGGTNGGNSSFGSYANAGGGNTNSAGGTVITGTGGAGGKGGLTMYGSGGGAGGYSGNAGDGGTYPTASTGGAGGSGATGSYAGAGGGGVGLYGQGTTGAGGVGNSEYGKGGSGGEDGQMGGVHSGVGANGGSGGKYGGGGGASDNTAGSGGGGAVRILWGTGRAFPSTNVSAS